MSRRTTVDEDDSARPSWTPHRAAADPPDGPAPGAHPAGVGGDDSWGARTHPECLLPAGEVLTFRFAFQGLL